MNTPPLYSYDESPRVSLTAAPILLPNPGALTSRGGAPGSSSSQFASNAAAGARLFAQQHMPSPLALQTNTGSLVDLNLRSQSPSEVDTPFASARDGGGLRLFGQQQRGTAFGSHTDIASMAGGGGGGGGGGVGVSLRPPSLMEDAFDNNTLSPLPQHISSQRQPVSRSTSHSAVQVHQAPQVPSTLLSSYNTAPPGSGLKVFSTISGSASVVSVSSIAAQPSQAPPTPTSGALRMRSARPRLSHRSARSPAAAAAVVGRSNRRRLRPPARPPPASTTCGRTRSGASL